VTTPRARFQRSQLLGDDPLWYKDAIIYEVPVRAFFDSDADGSGDFRGLTDKLDYIRDLGVTAVWLLPFYPSPLLDDGYDISDFGGVNPAYGTPRDFRAFLREAHRRGIRVITELVLNHTSDQHPWFQRARRAAPGSRLRDFYVWSDTADKYRDARIIFGDFEPSNWSWDSLAGAYYWHRFYHHQPDLNFENPAVRAAMLSVVDSWLKAGVDGLRLDAVPYLYEREGTNCENLPETHDFLRSLRAHVDKRFPGRMLLAEANQWPEDAIAYFGRGDEAHMAFHFPLMPRLFMAIRMEDRFPVIEILDQTPQIAPASQWALFLRNHDELTLEMVTDEERDYMNRIYAHDPQARVNLGIRRRLAPLLENNRRRIELMTALLFSMPGTPVIYYGDEIGMGDNIYLGDRDSVRTPMQWSGDRNGGFSRANPQRLYLPVVNDPEYHYEAVNVETQQNNPHSLLWWMKRLIALRKRFRAFGRGDIQFLDPENRKVLVFIRRYEDERILVIANLSRFVQNVELDLSAYEGMVPVEMFGGTPFPAIGRLPYFVTLGPHSFYWFSLGPARVKTEAMSALETGIPTLAAASADDILRGRVKGALEGILPAHLQGRRWFGGKARTVRSAKVADAVPIPLPESRRKAYLSFLRIDYVEGEPETYLLPLTFAEGDDARHIAAEFPQAAVAWLEVAPAPSAARRRAARDVLLYDALWDQEFCQALLRALERPRRLKGDAGEIAAGVTPRFRQLRGRQPLQAEVVKADQSNTSVVYGDRLILKLFRRLDAGVNPELEIGRFLTEHAPSVHAPPVAGFLEYRQPRREPLTLAVVQELVPHAGDAWQYTLDSVNAYFEQVLATPQALDLAPPAGNLLDLAGREPPETVAALIGPYAESAALLGRRTAELHIGLASPTDDPAFAPEPITPLYRRSLYQSMRNLTGQAIHALKRRLPDLPPDARADAEAVLAAEKAIRERFHAIVERGIGGTRIRCHGDYHLGQVLYTGKDFLIIDFEGEPTRPLSERRIKRSPLRDVAGLLRSFHYAAYATILSRDPGGAVRAQDLPDLRPAARSWYLWVGAAFLKAYLDTARPCSFLPESRDELAAMLDAHLLEKAVYELGYELNSRPDWVRIPLQGILDMLATESAGAA
jgi:maltose alpha-D-glucosyltransferase/alpha-amylase